MMLYYMAAIELDEKILDLHSIVDSENGMNTPAILRLEKTTKYRQLFYVVGHFIKIEETKDLIKTNGKRRAI